MTYHEGLRTMITLAPDEESAPQHGLSSLAANVPFRLLRHPSLMVEDIETIYCWLFCKSYDAIDIAQILAKRRFSGTLIAQTLNVPNPAMIKREVRTQNPKLRFEIEFTDSLMDGNTDYDRFIRDAELHAIKELSDLI